jgi:ketosteroid isomerase-like protein
MATGPRSVLHKVPLMLDATDYFAIQNLVHTYPKLLDNGRLEELGALFAHATVIIQGVDDPIVKNPARITAMFRDFLQLYDGKPRTRHQMANLIIEADQADGAVASCSVTVFQQTADLPLQPNITGDYEDRFERTDTGWRFTERRIANDLFGNLSAHGRYEYRPAG